MSRTYFAPDGQTSASDQYQQFAENATQPISNQSPTHDSTGPTGAPEGYSLVYADNAFQDTDTTSQYHAAAGAGESPDGTTFEDRLRSLMRRQGDELRAFAEREARNVDEIRSQAAGLANASPHEFLYSVAMQPLTPQDTITRMDAALEHLHQALGYDGFLAVVTPVDADGDGGITAGTKVGLEFWKGLRGGGLAGLKSLKLRCKASRETMGALSDRLGGNTNSTTTSTASRKSLDIKQELNSAMRNALREAAGDPLAEMRWTKPDQLEGYGVRIIGWPPEIALRNPSNNPVRDNKTLLQLLKSGQLRFVRKDSAEWEQADPSALVRSTAQAAQAQTSAQVQPQHIPPTQFVSPQPPVARTTSTGFIHPHAPHPHAQPPASLQHPPPPQQTPQTAPPPPGQPQTMPHQQQLQHPQIAYVYQVPPPGQAWIPLPGVYGTPFAPPSHMVTEDPNATPTPVNPNPSPGPGPGQGPSPIPPPPSGAVSPNATTARKRRSEAGGAGGGKKRNRTTAVEAASG
ncbi:hypothetical protein RhiXN_03412 [Rhizoctonia solani]|uniref:Uncharacterized protein n=1 Tax=Rhizoctonia solani TaxID=456999 RepID=A0A8H7LG34_9AGAM|nr:uncharacterized protein RhiXN_03412 [Rhizoctonia solani]KAF8676856.1 hypothetical protein RHS04_06284 [Rhizoctonia solani]QRW18488.1 hypothetical protein RhiXN_03412 [Rhizoctonia solani]